MDYTTLGRTGLRVSVVGLGAGGPSKLGMRTDKSHAELVPVVREALDAGVNLIDTSEAYGAEDIVGEGIRGVRREDVVISTKKSMRGGGELPGEEEIVAGLEGSLERLGTDYVDIYHLHAVRSETYSHAREVMVPALLRLRDQGKIRFLGITETFSRDPGHAMLQQAVREDCWDVMMVGFNILNQSARARVLPITRQKGIGTLIMFAVRRALSRPERLREAIADLTSRGLVDADALDDGDPLGFLTRDGVADSLTDAAYRFCRYEAGADVILSGTGNVAHLRENIASLCRPDLPAEERERLAGIFANVDDVAGN